jgi:penicillin-binding protein 1A
MVRDGHTSPEAAALFLDEPVAVPRSGGRATPMAAYLTAVRREVRRLFGEQLASTEGLVVHAALDPRAQLVAEEAVIASLDAHALRQPGGATAEGAAVAIENATGRVMLVTGGRNTVLEGFVRATRATRQPGSSFKPYVYGSALMGGKTQITTVIDGPLSLPAGGGKTWSPKNYVAGYAGALSLRSAMARSLNTVAVRLVLERGPAEVARLAKAMGVRTPLRVDPTMALGSSEVTPLDQALGYSTIARMGVPTDPVWILQVDDSEGRVLGRAGDRFELGGKVVTLPGGPLPRAMPAGVAYELADMMRGVVMSGTARKAFDPRFDRAGKTGTTNGFQDAWFVGFTPRWTVAVWVGAEGAITLGDGETGGKAALPVWLAIVQHLGETEGERLPVPPEAVLLRHEGLWLGFDRANPPEKLLTIPAADPLPEW